ncbi:hypothetical protein LP419_39500 [Massilia sp. H-1]|nr:hypothetical protein LP419_39500 [Massilia sp. H-1]
MKPSALALALTSTLLSGVAAQAAESNVQIYGLIDAGVDYTTHANACSMTAPRASSRAAKTLRAGASRAAKTWAAA